MAVFGNFGGYLDKKSGNTDQIKTITVSAKFQTSAFPLELQAKYRFHFDFTVEKTPLIKVLHPFFSLELIISSLLFSLPDTSVSK